MGPLPILLALIFLFLWFLPIIIVALSNRTQGLEKAAWILALVFVSWFAWLFYWLLAPVKRKT